MEQKEFNPIIEAVVSIRHYAIAMSNNWSSMKAVGAVLKDDIEKATNMVKAYGSDSTIHQWASERIGFDATKSQLQEIMNQTISKIKNKSAKGLLQDWNTYPGYVSKIESTYERMKELGFAVVPENRNEEWANLWKNIHLAHTKMVEEAEAIGIQLGLMEQCSPDEVDELSDTILKHIPIKYSREEAHKYTDDYMEAYAQLKKEASQKKNLWDRFLDILAGGTQQTPAQRVMMQRWVDGEKGDAN
nr:hypothetical protein [Allomuricauda sp.]